MQEKGRNSTACTVVMLLVYQGDSFLSLRFPFIGNNLLYFSWYSTLHHFILLSLQETNKYNKYKIKSLLCLRFHHHKPSDHPCGISSQQDKPYPSGCGEQSTSYSPLHQFSSINQFSSIIIIIHSPTPRSLKVIQVVWGSSTLSVTRRSTSLFEM